LSLDSAHQRKQFPESRDNPQNGRKSLQAVHQQMVNIQNISTAQKIKTPKE
jgi:hypothetical protein